jgi:hypothetical protein
VVAVFLFTDVHFLWYNVVGAVTVFGVGLLISATDRGLADTSRPEGPQS